ncbi:MAG: hypothetical protein HYS12_14230 [Planctomycetes bacterium]|nr:hypothetical protein [Planctomycetota bacterium]
MFRPITRRGFVAGTVTAGAAATLAEFAFLQSLPRVDAKDAKAQLVPLEADIEPLVRLIEDTDRSKLLESIADRIHAGTSYQQLLGALFLAGVRGIQPRPVGFKFHAVLVVNSAYLASLAATDNDRWLPLFWALDNFKGSQAANEQQGDWHMAPVNEAKVPRAHQARQRFVEAMDDWNEEAADVAVASLVRSAGAAEVIELFWRYGARDFRSIGHKAIYVANAWRALQAIGWRHAEPIMRSLAYALLAHEGDNPAKRDAEPDVPFRDNRKRARRIRGDWQRGTINSDATTDILSNQRKASPSEACDQLVDILNKKVDPASVWDAMFLTAGELLMRQPGIVGLHCVTTVNALHYAYQATGNDETRRLMLLQAAAFLPMFRKAMEGRGTLSDLRVDRLEKGEVAKDGTKEDAIKDLFREVSRERLSAAKKTLAALTVPGLTADVLMKEARRLVFAKGNDAHDYKFSSAALEDYYHVTPGWRERFLATSMFNLRGSGGRDTGLLERTRAALSKS